MKFFTDKTVRNDYLLIKIKDYRNWQTAPKGGWGSIKKEVFIDPGVYELTKSNEYSWINEIDIEEFIKYLPDNCYFTLDYPCDMNEKYTDLFLEKSWDSAIRYCQYSQYIVTVQSEFNKIRSFVDWFDKYNNLSISSGILGLGNVCRIHYLTKYMRNALTYAFKFCKHPRIHIYGLGMRLIPYAYDLAKQYNIELSMDSTKWTRHCKKSGLPSCRKDNRQEYFNLYLDTLEKRGIKLENRESVGT